MTITSTNSREVSNGNDTAVEFPFAFKINKKADLVVTHIDVDLNKTVLEEGTGVNNYSVAGDFPGSGAITFPAAGSGKLATGERLVIERIVTLTQETDLVNNGPWNPDIVEDMHDYAIMVAQQNEDKAERSLKVSIADDTGADYELPPAKADTVIGVWDQSAEKIVNGPSAGDIVNAQSNAALAAAKALEASDDAIAAALSAASAAAAAQDAANKISGTGTAGAMIAYAETTGEAEEVAPGDVDSVMMGNGSGKPASMKNLFGISKEWTKSQNFAATTLTDGVSIAWDLEDNQVAEVTLTDNRTLAAPVNMKDGGTYILRVKQDATGGRALAFAPEYRFPGGSAPVLSSAANAVDILTFVSDGTNMDGVFVGNFA